jgi:hypothetical protein
VGGAGFEVKIGEMLRKTEKIRVNRKAGAGMYLKNLLSSQAYLISSAANAPFWCTGKPFLPDD